MQTSKQSQLINTAIAVAFCIIAPTIGYIKIGLPPVIIVGGSAIIGFFFWYFTYLKQPTDPKIILPLFVLTVAGLQIHIVEEYLTGFGPAMSRLFNIPWSEEGFLMVFALVGPTIYTLTTLGLYYRIPIAGFIAWFIFIGPGVAEFTHFIFPLLEPQLQPANSHAISQTINGTEIANMPNYYFKTTGKYYFAGMWTAILPMVPGIYAIYRLTKEYRLSQKNNINS
ncbi:hypothetical protein FNO01nite_26350 [Flavobacterium noncentrifugens]|uniref:Uncharacterized protein n=1 Tax=Flavobacterium noncentrifugens TaxID=1128970 RepID=A0A1G8ZH02_9FLAO|nr:hypothetical protein [Flavobacterium noncentrifugens]GEP51963.1 hypothetical protein FNO01nite_26350 [Flavobacterium noncentrifugens]SDK13675.1 hypothetical protein SAMN04487935_2564 [Flavobacterium noncentrifugens]